MSTYYKQDIILGVGDAGVDKRHKSCPPWVLHSAECAKEVVGTKKLTCTFIGEVNLYCQAD